MYQKNVINNHRTFIIQQHFFTYQRKSNQELEVQLLKMIVAGLQNQSNHRNASSPLLVMMNTPVFALCKNTNLNHFYKSLKPIIYKYVGVNICIYTELKSPHTIFQNPRPKHKSSI